MPTYVLRDIDSDLSGGAAFNRALLTTGGTAASQVVSLSADQTKTGRGFTSSGEPGTNGANGDLTVEVNVTTGSTTVQISVQLHRVNSAGTVQTSSSISSEQQATVGLKTFTFLDMNLGTWVSGNRLRVDYRFRDTSGAPNSVTFELNTSDAEVTTPTEAPIYFFIPGFLWSGTKKRVVDFLPGTFFTERVSTSKVESIPGSGGGGASAGGRAERDRTGGGEDIEYGGPPGIPTF